jgi:hypothetical protein
VGPYEAAALTLQSVAVGPQTGILNSGTAGSATFSISLTKSGGSGSATLSLTSALPPGVTASFDPNPVTVTNGGASTLTISTSSTTPAGITTFTVQAVASNTVTSSGTLTINGTDQTITVGTHAPASAAYNIQFTVAATASSGLAVTYSSGSPSVCTNSGATFTMVAASGTCVVHYDQAGGGMYNAAPQVTENVAATKATPTVSTWPTAGAITYGQTLASSTLTGGSVSVPGTFAFTNPSTVPDAGTASQSVTFTPTDTTNYNTVVGKVDVTANKATPTVTAWPTAGAITYGQALASSTLTGGTASVAGTFALTNPSTIPNAGAYSASVTFTPTDTTNYNTVVGSVDVTVNKATPNVTSWPTASAITYGQTLASSTLSGGTASVAGSFAFTTPSTAPGVGTASQSVTFTPTDTTNYNTVVGSVSVTVNEATATLDHIVISPSSASITAGGSQAYTATAYDASNNNLGVVTGSTIFTISPNGSCTGADCTASVTGNHTVTGVYSVKSATASLTVAANGTALPPTASGDLVFNAVSWTVTLTDTSSDSDSTPVRTVTVSWGDGVVVTQGPGTTFTHTYQNAGSYIITQMAKDTAELTNYVQYNVTAANPQVVGHVYASDGKTPLSGALVYVTRTSNGKTNSYVTASKADGSFSYYNIGPGSYSNLRATRSGYTFTVIGTVNTNGTDNIITAN